jgi:hypothetical protein
VSTIARRFFTTSKTVPVILLLHLVSYPARHVTLPADETEAVTMLAHHEIDSSLWEIIEPFYQQPISVPYGESGILMQLFPELDLEIPVSEDQLARYSPWDKKKIAQFFKEYPELVFYKPILDFSMNVPVKSGRICASVDRNGATDRTSQRMQFSLEPLRWISADGRADFTDYTARWKNRKLFISPQKQWAITAGNAAPMADKYRMVSGRFGRRNPEVNDIADNWLYGEKRGWNTLMITISSDKILKGLKVQPFIHKRLSESVAGVSSVVSINSNIEGKFDLIGMDMRELADTLLYGVFSTRINYSGLTTELTLATPVKHSPTIPVRLDLGYCREQDEFDLECMYFPVGFRGPGSSALEDFIKGGDLSYQLTEDQFSYDITWKHHIASDIFVRPSLIMKMSDMQIWFLNPGLIFSVQKELYSLMFGYQRFEPLSARSIRTKDEISIGCSAQPHKKVNLQLDMCTRTFINKNWYFSSSLEPVLTILPEVKMSPGIKYKKYNNKPCDLALSLANTLYLFKSIYSDMSIEKYLTFNGKKGLVSAHAKMWFVF